MYSRIVKVISLAVLVMAAFATLRGAPQILTQLVVMLSCALVFLASLRYLRPELRMSLASITDLPARGESL